MPARKKYRILIRGETLRGSSLHSEKHHKMTNKTFSDVVQKFYDYVQPRTGEPAPLIGEETYQVIMEHKDTLDAAVIHDRDFELDYFGFKTLN